MISEQGYLASDGIGSRRQREKENFRASVSPW